MNEERRRMLGLSELELDSHRESSHDRSHQHKYEQKHDNKHHHTRHHRSHSTRDRDRDGAHRHNSRSKRRFPSLSFTLPPLQFSAFPGYKIEEAPDFDTDNEEVPMIQNLTRESLVSGGVVDTPSELNNTVDGKHVIDRIRMDDGSIDLGLQKHLPSSSIETPHSKRRKMINYDTRPSITNSAVNEKMTELPVKTDKSKKEEVETIPFEFGDRGSTWRMLKLSKLPPNPTSEDIFTTYATLWDYELACMERDELDARKRGKSRDRFVSKPNRKFMESKRAHYAVNKSIMGKYNGNRNDVHRATNVDSTEDVDEGGAVIEIKKHRAPMSKSQKLRNELKLAKLVAMDYDADDDDIMSREMVESLAESP